MQREEKFILEAIQLSQKGMEEKAGGPFGCIIVKEGKIIGRGCNQVTSANDPTAHAEIVAIRDACHNLKSFQLDGCEIYTSCEPCPMCMGAIYWARPSIVYYANDREAAAQAGFDDAFIYKELQVPVKKRKIKMVQLASDKAEAVFRKWMEMGDKRLY